MLELDDTLTYRLTGKDAVLQRAKVLLTLQPTDIPYYKKGMDRSVFSYNSPRAAIEEALEGMNPQITISETGTARVTVANVSFSLDELIGEVVEQ